MKSLAVTHASLIRLDGLRRLNDPAAIRVPAAMSRKRKKLKKEYNDDFYPEQIFGSSRLAVF